MNEHNEQHTTERRVVIVVEPQRWRSLARVSRPTPWPARRSPWAAVLSIGLLALPALGGSASGAGALALEEPQVPDAPVVHVVGAAAPAVSAHGSSGFGTWVAQVVDEIALVPYVKDDWLRNAHELPPVIDGAVMIELPPRIEGAVLIEPLGRTWAEYEDVALTAFASDDDDRRSDDCRDETETSSR